MRRLMTHAQAEDRPSSVADQSITIGRKGLCIGIVLSFLDV